jgi:hypothetical protein
MTKNWINSQAHKSGRVERAVFVLICVVAIVPLMLTALVQIIGIEAKSGYRNYIKARTRLLH